MTTALAVDIGGTKFEVGIVDDAGRILIRRRVPTPVGADDEALFTTLAALIDEVRAEARSVRDLPDPSLCGVGCGGPMTSGGLTISPINIPGWREFPLRARLATHMGLPVTIDNDAKALALAEGWVGAAQGVDDYMAMVVSTGVGGGIVLDGRLLDGADGNAGHIGHVCVVPDGRPCACGARGCLEAEASGTAIAAITGRPASEAAPEIIERTGMLVGRAVSSVVNLLDLRLTVVAGSVALGFGDAFMTAARAEFASRSRIVFAEGAELRFAGLGADGPLIGAAAVTLRAAR